MSADNTKRRSVTVEVECDTNRLYADLPDAIAYLEEIRAAHPGRTLSLDEHWTGYEDMTMRFVYVREETDEELAHRLEHEQLLAEINARKRSAEQEKEKRREQYERLHREFGR